MHWFLKYTAKMSAFFLHKMRDTGEMMYDVFYLTCNHRKHFIFLWSQETQKQQLLVLYSDGYGAFFHENIN